MKRLIALALLPFLCSCGEDGTGAIGDTPQVTGDYIVLAWNDLGMHCLNPTYNQLVVLPPYNTLWAQVIQRGAPPRVVTAGVAVEYRIVDNTTSYPKAHYGQFWQYGVQLFGSIFGITELPLDVGLKGAGLAGAMEPSSGYFVVEGIPVVPIYDSNGSWDPYQVAEIVVKDADGVEIAKTRTTVPTSEEMKCSRCHGDAAFLDILSKHDSENGTSLSAAQPVLCQGCHGDPALGLMSAGTSGVYLSKAIHEAHADRGAACYDCHPGPITRCSRSLRHTTDDGYCVNCHGTIAAVASSIPTPRLPWVNEPNCSKCHSSAIPDVNTGDVLYRNAMGHGNLYCAACHGSPHAMIPSRESADNYQSRQYQGFTSTVKSLGSCGVCHESSRGADEIAEFDEKHGSSSPKVYIGCHMCHSSVPANTLQWPHGYQWHNTN